jgi:hypothetical protein
MTGKRLPTADLAKIAPPATTITEAGAGTFVPGSGSGLTREAIALKIAPLNGNLDAIARALGSSRRTIKRIIDSDPALLSAWEDAREGMTDNAESALYRGVIAGQAWAVCFYLKTQGRKRGYIERAETFNLNVNMDLLTVEQLERLASGEHPSLVLGADAAGDERIRTIDAVATAGASGPGPAQAADGDGDDS